MIAIIYTQADVDQYKDDKFKATADRMGHGLLAKHDASGPPKEPAVYSARSGKLMDFSLNRKPLPSNKLNSDPLLGCSLYMGIPNDSLLCLIEQITASAKGLACIRARSHAC